MICVVVEKLCVVCSLILVIGVGVNCKMIVKVFK